MLAMHPHCPQHIMPYHSQLAEHQKTFWLVQERILASAVIHGEYNASYAIAYEY